jgi:hypothetical protein
MHLCEAPIGELVGLRLIDDGPWQIYEGPLAVARLGAGQARIQPITRFFDPPPTQQQCYLCARLGKHVTGRNEPGLVRRRALRHHGHAADQLAPRTP